MFFKKHIKSPEKTIEVIPANETLNADQEKALSEKDLYDDHGCAIVGDRKEKVVFLEHPHDDAK